ncbi:hypothetical protein ANAPC1_01344 [Anaplasma phagocytophilum]|uniref:Major outer membrane protein P44-20 n=1 Tax=Anaplasma phagocytophilum TaxID=948 RepID=A0AA45ZIA3_ANAPH|nr:hypothetical protein ANAPC1_01344 [Anaplasma phagocytophilum]SBO32573.1 hypothetical protein ANAPC3_00910 [Anaplasma phagocytophilum]SBO32667.1 hypothetical protein ANAPC2_01107 [Anaplasma phagocytophilum]SBO33050.1 hypothetical protein ANAPC4_01017 [Anaplasma phagocytophilum]SCV64697.1 hypothetical protein ANAPC5_00939 [Anaplasma phagocytophilum]
MKITNSTIDGKVCAGSHAALVKTKGKTYKKTPAKGSDGFETSQCSGLADSAAPSDQKLLSTFVSAAGIAEGENWPTGRAADTDSSTIKEGGTNSNANAVAKDLVALNSDEKTIVAGLLAKTIEGGEVVEIRAVSSTSVMVNSSVYMKLHHMM